MGEHTHGRCDSTCPSYAHGCMNCAACRESREVEGEVDFFSEPLAGIEVRFKESLGKPAVLLSAEPEYGEFVPTWHPVDATRKPVELPLGEPIYLPDGLGELRLSTREVPPPAVEAPEVSGG